MIGVGRVKREARISTQGTSVALRCCLGGAPLTQGLPRPPPLIPFGRGFRFGEWHENWSVYFSESVTSEML
jgi:hypothetical protein